MNFPEFTFVDERLAKVENRWHAMGAAMGNFAEHKAQGLYREIQESLQGSGTGRQGLGRLLGQLCSSELIDTQHALPHFTIDRETYYQILTPMAKRVAEVLYDSQTAKAAEMIGKTILLK